MLLFRLQLCVFCILVACTVPSSAQASGLFQWDFVNNGTPPYYMIAFSVGGTPTTTLIGTDESNLSWTITEPAGDVVDANGSAGGVQPRIFTVKIQTPPFNVKANVTRDLQACQPWGLTAMGGVPPYTATIIQLASSNVTNITGLAEGSFTYINDGNADGQIIGQHNINKYPKCINIMTLEL
ncbi:hypothetical protein HYPSUDRAFT_149061 [Hypholoma sublateritium FD-334 SS-4]|uniref:Uncharacterized protein n=1 Tax=Hypholoma sublateritium (strain FD-334 SS-4) TaxID=945553 RepID=A0A0D2P4R7_HYPSF|nr:hypothetical protein HYPSUDRAFT_149061 [Hypholoma sublateritium FD-334 SS-4]